MLSLPGGGVAGPDPVHFPVEGSLHAGARRGRPLPGPSPHAPRANFNLLHGSGGGGGGGGGDGAFSNYDYEDPVGYAPRDTFNALHGTPSSPNYEDDEDRAPAPHPADALPHDFRLSPHPAPWP